MLCHSFLGQFDHFCHTRSLCFSMQRNNAWFDNQVDTHNTKTGEKYDEKEREKHKTEFTFDLNGAEGFHSCRTWVDSWVCCKFTEFTILDVHLHDS